MRKGIGHGLIWLVLGAGLLGSLGLAANQRQRAAALLAQRDAARAELAQWQAYAADPVTSDRPTPPPVRVTPARVSASDPVPVVPVTPPPMAPVPPRENPTPSPRGLFQGGRGRPPGFEGRGGNSSNAPPRSAP